MSRNTNIVAEEKNMWKYKGNSGIKQNFQKANPLILTFMFYEFW